MFTALSVCAAVSLLVLSGCNRSQAQIDPAPPVVAQPQNPPSPTTLDPAQIPEQETPVTPVSIKSEVEAKEIPDFVHKGLGWLAEAQHKGGGWGGGSHANQQNRDPHAVQTDPATTAFSAMALLRAGHTPVSGDYRDTVRRATAYLLEIVENSSEAGPKITDVTGTQPQSKLGPFVDTSMTAQYLARVLPTVKTDKELYARVDAALDKCLRKLESTQKEDGSWNGGGGWAPVLQSSLSCTALEIAQANGKQIDKECLDKARKYQKKNVNVTTGRASADAAAGVELYAFSAGQRANAAEAREAKDVIRWAKEAGDLDAAAPVSKQNLIIAGCPDAQAAKLADAFNQDEVQARRLDDETLLAGFGNNGGEEFLSYLMTSESLVISGGENWKTWNSKMHERLAKIQNPNGSWNGHHCISSPVFCTAAVVQCLTTDRDAPILMRVAQATVAKASAK
jgi:hypothetical protein